MPESIASNTTTLFLVDTSFSMTGTSLSSQESELDSALSAAWTAAADEEITGAQVGMAGFLGETVLSQSILFAPFVPKYKVHARIG